MIINPTATVFENLIELIKESNPSFTGASSGQLTLTTPVEDTTVEDRNTRIGIIANANMGYKGAREVRYRRCVLVEGLVSPPQSVTLLENETLEQVTTRLIGLLNLHPDEVIADIPDSSTVTFTAAEDSVLYLPDAHHCFPVCT